MIELHRAIYKEGKQLDNSKLETNLKEFYQAVEDKVNDPTIQEYSKAVLQGTNNRSGRITRGKIIAGIINSSFNSKDLKAKLHFQFRERRGSILKF